MKKAVVGFALIGVLWAAAPAGAYIEELYPLQRFMAESEVIAEGVIEKTDLKTRTSVAKITKSLKGKCHYELIKMNIGASGFEGHADATLPHLVVGAPVVIFYDAGRRGEIYVNRFFMQLYGDPAAPPDKAWWTFTHIEIRCNRTFNGPADELAKLVADIQEGKAKPPLPDAKLPSISLVNVKALPVWGKPVDVNSLPPCFMKRDPNKKPKPREPDAPAAIVKGLAYEYYEGAWNEVPDFDALKPAATGTAEQFDLSKAKRPEQIGLRFKGFIDIAKEGMYTFYTVSDDGSKLWIGKSEVVTNDGLHPPAEQAGEIPLKAGKHAITVSFFENSGGEYLEVWYEGPDVPKQKIPPAVLFRSASP